jgi:hypothetical protein
VKTCFACAKSVDDADRYCGHCGADQTRAPAPPRPAGAPEAAAYEPPEKPSRRGRGVAILLATVVLVAIGAVAYTGLSRDGESSALRVALDNIGLTSDPETVEEPVAEPSETPTVEPEATETPVLAEAPTGGPLALQPGNWQFTTQLIGISKVNPNDDFEINRQGIGASESHSLCVTPAASETPRAIAFPFPPGMACSPASFDMSDGSYSSRLTCSFPQFGGRRPVAANGQYSRINTSVNVSVQVPAQVVEGDFDQPPEILMQYRINGYLTGPC